MNIDLDEILYRETISILFEGIEYKTSEIKATPRTIARDESRLKNGENYRFIISGKSSIKKLWYVDKNNF